MPATIPALVIGGGFFGCELAVRLRKWFRRVVLVERDSELLRRASYNNQARVHNGYHYPRDRRTAWRSRINYQRFRNDYAECIDARFTKYYAIARKFSKVTARQFEMFCRSIQAPCTIAKGAIRSLFKFQLIDEVFQVEECAFNAVALRDIVSSKLNQANVEVQVGASVCRLTPQKNGGVAIDIQQGHHQQTVIADHVFLCVYSNLNAVLHDSGLSTLPLKNELTEIALVDVPPALQSIGVTVMCGPFFSCMPFPARGVHSLSHVRYTPHASWSDPPAPRLDETPASNHTLMQRDCSRYMPILSQANYKESLWETKTVLVRNEENDGRPILMQTLDRTPSIHCVLGSKIDNIYDALEYLENRFGKRKVA